VTIRVLIADDQALVRAGIRMLVETQPDLEVVAKRRTEWPRSAR
jgi:DNA-binding NarL/FixJ family response regulator